MSIEVCHFGNVIDGLKLNAFAAIFTVLSGTQLLSLSTMKHEFAMGQRTVWRHLFYVLKFIFKIHNSVDRTHEDIQELFTKIRRAIYYYLFLTKPLKLFPFKKVLNYIGPACCLLTLALSCP